MLDRARARMAQFFIDRGGSDYSLGSPGTGRAQRVHRQLEAEDQNPRTGEVP